MIKVLKIIFCFCPFLVTIIVLLLLQNTKKIQVIEKTDPTTIENKKEDSKELERWHASLNSKLEKLEKNQVIIKKDTKIYGLNDLNENKKLLLKIMFLHKLKKEAESFAKNQNDEKINISVKKIEEMIIGHKQKLYNNNRNMDLLDKNFLDNLNVYIQH